MARFLPAQIKLWTEGTLLQPSENQKSSEHFYRGISTDTRKLRKGEIFLALKGERFDGHDFIDQAAEKGSSLLIMEENSDVAARYQKRLKKEDQGPDLLLVPDTLQAYQRIASGYRQTLLASVVAITGSVGKTTTRRMVETALSSQAKTHETADNENNLIGLPLTMLQADDDDDVVVAELGMDRKGEIATLSQISKPDIAIVTSIGYSHAEYLGSREDILKEKMDIVQGLKPNGLLLINGQDESLRKWVLENKTKHSVWAICNASCSQYMEDVSIPRFWAEDIKLSPQGTEFVAKTSLDPKMKVKIYIPQPGKFLVRAALFGIATAYALGMDVELAAKACEGFKNTGARQAILELGPWLVIDDSYNASPESIMTALDTLDMLAEGRGRKILCLGGARELGKYEEELHLEIGKKIARFAPDRVYLVGDECRYVEQALKEEGASMPIIMAKEVTEIRDNFMAHLEKNDVVLLKGSRYYEMERLRGEMESALAGK